MHSGKGKDGKYGGKITGSVEPVKGRAAFWKGKTPRKQGVRHLAKKEKQRGSVKG